MKHALRLFMLSLCCSVGCSFAALAQAPPGRQAFLDIRQCVMQSDPSFCHAHLTPSSYAIFDRFASYRLMPCLPTDFTYIAEVSDGRVTQVKASMPESAERVDILWLVFVHSPRGLLLDLPQSLKRGLGQNWESKLQMSEQIYLMMRQNMGDKLNCDMLNGLLKPKGKN